MRMTMDSPSVTATSSFGSASSSHQLPVTTPHYILVSDVNYFLVLFIPFLFLLSSVMPAIIQKVSQQFSAQTRREVGLQKEIKAIKEEMSTLSMVDDFAKYSKLKRKLVQFNLSLESDVGARQAVQQKFIQLATYGSYIVIGIIYIATLFYFGHKQPVFIISSEWFYPMNYVFSYPTGVDGGVSILVWSILSRSTLTALIK